MYTLNFIDSICGGGKTSAAIQHMIKSVGKGERYILLQPSIILINQTAARFKEDGFTGPLVVIHSDNGTDPVAKRIHAFLNDPDASGVLITTIQAWEGIKRRKVNEWHVIVDECIQIFRVSKISSQHLKDELLQYLEFTEELDGYSKVKVRHGSYGSVKALEQKARTDSAFETFDETVKYLLLNNKTWVRTDLYKQFNDGYAKALTFYHVASPSMLGGFKSVTIMSANFKHSELYLLWKYWGVQFKQRTGFKGYELSSSHHKDICEKLDIYYLSDEWSQSLKRKYLNIYQAEYKRAITEIFGEDRFIHTMNSRDYPFVLEGYSKGEFVRPKAHGINDYREVNNAALFGHFNMSYDQVKFLRTKFKLTKQNLWDLRNNDIYYQFICRISLREMPLAGSEISDKKIIVMDKDMGIYINKLFEGSRIHKFQSDLIDSIQLPKIGRKPEGIEPASGKDRMKKSRARKLLFDTSRKLQILNGTYWDNNNSKVAGLCDEMILLGNNDINGRKGGSISILGKINANTFDSHPYNTFEELVEFLKVMSNRKIENKSDNQLFNLTTFTEQKTAIKKRTLDQVIHSNGILMDMDSEDNCDPEEFAKFMSGVQMLIYSSFQSSLQRRRWRVVINISRPVSEPEYNRIVKDVLDLCEDHGFRFDEKKRANDFMYLPCHGLNHNAFFFNHYKGDIRKPLDVDTWFSFNRLTDTLPKICSKSANDNLVEHSSNNSIYI